MKRGAHDAKYVFPWRAASEATASVMRMGRLLPGIGEAAVQEYLAVRFYTK